ncbi:VOC family protein [Chryseosolibacter indicus]|uniref:VOC family protein n=1 Tax=Chryseosolibacter indicus TaxID=2782351 RepID=A0ABS5VN43_9BACT|nr:VOC family protein [Chryseosolibacter indicus]MBT1702858.1 VOC family protein [Chryseosolibacter indicus]
MTRSKPTFRNPQVNLYVRDVQAVSHFYVRFFGFSEIFRTPSEGEPVHIELKLDNFILGVASMEAAKNIHNIPASSGPPRAEIALWTDNVDVIFDLLIKNEVREISKPHNFLSNLRAAWVYDPDGNPVQIVSKIK